MIELYTAATPNGWKVSVTLEELGLPYDVFPIDLSQNVQKSDWYLKLNPNGRIPTIVDRQNHDFAVFESGAILMYLAEKTGRLLPSNRSARSLVIQWLMFQMGGVGPMMGQANVFYRYFPENIPAAVSRYQNEVRRLFLVLDQRLAQSEWLADDFSIADIANWCWVRTYKWSGVQCEDLVNLKRWRDQIRKRPAAQRGVEVPGKSLRSDDEQAAADFVAKARNSLQE